MEPLALLPRSSRFWIIAFLGWFAVLFFLSSAPVPIEDAPDIPHLDKLLHFIYYAGGGTGLHLAIRYRKNPPTPLSPRPRLKAALPGILLVAILIALCGVFDEWHQSHVPGRTGNDPYDCLADLLGGFASYWIHRPIASLIERHFPAVE